MLKHLRPLLILAFALPAASHAATPDDDATDVASTVKRVAVYSDRARVTRVGTISVKAGRQRVAVRELPYGLDDASVSANLPGRHQARILSIEVEDVHGKRTATEEAKKLLAKLEDLQAKDRALVNAINALSQEETFLNQLQVQPPPNEKGQPQPVALNPTTWRGTLDFAEGGLVEARKRRRAKETERQQLAKEMQALNLEIQKVRSYETFASKQIVLEIQGERSEKVDLEVIYAIRGPSWRPSYDVRVLSASGQVEIVTYGVVRQSTGEDWNKVELTLSTAAPHRGANLPDLLAWRLGDQQQYQTAAASGEVGAMGAGQAEMPDADRTVATTETVDMKSVRASRSRRDRGRRHKTKITLAPKKAESRPMPPPAAAPEPMYSDDAEAVYDEEPEEEMVAGGLAADIPAPVTRAPARTQRQESQAWRQIRQVSEHVWSLPPGGEFQFVSANRDFTYNQNMIYCPTPQRSAGGYDYAYQPERKKTLLSDNRERRIPLATAKLPAELLYEIVAPLEEKAYLRATVKNDSKRPMLAGESFIFLDDDFVGRAFVKTVAPTEKLDLSLGADEDVKVERRLEETAENTGLISKKEKTKHEVLVTVQSFKKRKVDVLVRDQIPITWQKDDIKILDAEVSPKPDKDPDRGMYEWKMSVSPGKTAKIKLNYTVEHPRDFDLYERRGG